MPATWSENTITNQALTMMNQALGVSAITFTKAVMITDDITKYPVSQLQSLTTINYKQSRTPEVISTTDDKSRVGVTIDNQDVNEDYTYYGVGLYAKQNTTNKEILFSVVPLTEGATMAASENNVANYSIYLDLYTDIVRGTQVTIMVSNSGTLSREDVQQMISQTFGHYLAYPDGTAASGIDFNTVLGISITRIINDTKVINAPSGFSGTGYLTTIGNNDKTMPIIQKLDDTVNNIHSIRYFNSDKNTWSTWETSANASYVNQQLDKKVTDNKDGSIVVNGKTFVPADDAKVVHKSGDEEIAGTKTFDTAPIDKTTKKPYITSDGVPKVDTTKLVNTDGSADGNITNAKLSVKDGQLFVNGYPVLGGAQAKSEDDAKTQTAKTTGVIFFY